MKKFFPFMAAGLSFFLAQDTGGGGSGGDTTVFDFSPWIERLKAAPRKERFTIAGELSKILGIPLKETWQRLKEAGWNGGNAKDQPSSGADSTATDPPPPDETGEKLAAVTLRHKTQYQNYRCAGLVLKQQAESHQVTEAQLGRLRRDPWVEVAETKFPKE